MCWIHVLADRKMRYMMAARLLYLRILIGASKSVLDDQLQHNIENTHQTRGGWGSKLCASQGKWNTKRDGFTWAACRNKSHSNQVKYPTSVGLMFCVKWGSCYHMRKNQRQRKTIFRSSNYTIKWFGIFISYPTISVIEETRSSRSTTMLQHNWIDCSRVQ